MLGVVYTDIDNQHITVSGEIIQQKPLSIPYCPAGAYRKKISGFYYSHDFTDIFNYTQTCQLQNRVLVIVN